MVIPFDEWAKEVDALCLRHLLCDWDDLCGEIEPLQQSHEAGDAPLTFVAWWSGKYDLTWIDPAGGVCGR
ncbi:MAG: hypothetical protein R2708_02025 [Vicinamibacterales bacterium]